MNDCAPPGTTKDQQKDVLDRLNHIHRQMHAGKSYDFEQTLLCDLVQEITELRKRPTRKQTAEFIRRPIEFATPIPSGVMLDMIKAVSQGPAEASQFILDICWATKESIVARLELEP